MKRLVYIGVVFLLIIVVLSLIIPIPREVNLNFKLMGGINEKVYQFPHKVYIQEVMVNSGDKVNSGQPLMTISSPEISKRIGEIEQARHNLNNFYEIKAPAIASRIKMLETKAEGLRNSLTKLKELISLARNSQVEEEGNLEEQLQLSKKSYERSRVLHDKNVMSDADWENALASYKMKEQELVHFINSSNLQITDYQYDLETLETEKESILIEVQKIKAEEKELEGELLSALALAQRQLQLDYGKCMVKENSITLICDTLGQVSFLTVKESELNPEEIGLKVINGKEKYIAYAFANPVQIGELQDNLKAVLKFDAYPHFYYGSINAKVKSISSSTNEEGFYSVKLTLDNLDERFPQMVKGMTGTATVVIQEKVVLDYLLYQLLK
ncbi:HlyD family secretion protein [Fulvivirga sediminis]|uniref:HlyD family efflux transporter periplasmic adaptor subunit n=1 Tax=Fulvivirga sediminis TaxID=2803949 RepID=A0A937K285_9BACT|nr:HlyD family efflux transporter periplasmic adaptor subunit [Fulvivirga sediminis]MBL3658105.1 HlyD family efflux transporter periplasmic adaptor subunit [Fulvivirga sediminis]